MGVSALYVLSTVNFKVALYPMESKGTSMVLSGCTRPSSKAFRVTFRLVRSTPPVFLRTTKALVTSPMPCTTSILVLHPRISIEMDGPLGGTAVGIPGVSDETGTGLNVAVINGIAVAVGIGDVAVGLITTGVAVKMEGVWVGGRN